ncbi:MAG: hypothetical protein H7X99_01500 [Saprospiraceae bacterium]|nr:hypothetical protein [Saprospiraceae bacterium]
MVINPSGNIHIEQSTKENMEKFTSIYMYSTEFVKGFLREREATSWAIRRYFEKRKRYLQVEK